MFIELQHTNRKVKQGQQFLFGKYLEKLNIHLWYSLTVALNMNINVQ